MPPGPPSAGTTLTISHSRSRTYEWKRVEFDTRATLYDTPDTRFFLKFNIRTILREISDAEFCYIPMKNTYKIANLNELLTRQCYPFSVPTILFFRAEK